jgi:hypothetical protein
MVDAVDQEPQPLKKPGTFVKGHDPRRCVGQKRKASPSKIPNDIKRGCIEGFSKHGSDGKGKDGFPGFIFYLASKHPKAAARIVEKILPLTVNGTGLTPSTIRTVNVVSVPSGSFLSREELAKYAPPSLRQIEQEIVDTHADEPPQLEHAPEPQPTPPELLELLEQADRARAQGGAPGAA